MPTNRKKPPTRKQYAPDKRPNETWVEFQRRKYPHFGPPKQRDETWAEFEERQMRTFPGIFSGNGPVAFTRPGPAAPAAKPADPPAEPPAKPRPS
jgi:hypothetical protein